MSVSINSSGLANRFNGTKMQWINDSKNVEILPLRAFFFGLASENSTSKGLIVWLRIGNTSNQALLRWFVPLWPEIMRRIGLGDRLIEVS